MSNHRDTIISMDEEKQSLVNRAARQDFLIDSNDIQIDNNDFQNEEVALLDISSNRDWICYMTHPKRNSSSQRRTFITRRRFASLNENISCEITQHIKDGGSSYCKFLSISPSGQHMTLSFYEINFSTGNNRFRAPFNPYCLIFTIANGSIKLDTQIKFQGRAVFLNSGELALINPDFLEIYTSSFKKTHWFDLRQLGSSSKERVVNQNSYIKNAAWVSFKGREENDMRKLITFSRHIRNYILTTPFTGNMVRVWSIVDNGIRISSFRVQEKEHVVGFSNDHSYIATCLENSRTVNIYKLKTGLLVYKLKSQKKGPAHRQFDITHIRFCHDDQYLSMSALEKTPSGTAKKVLFEVWYIKAEVSIFFTERPIDLSGLSNNHKIILPFVTKGTNSADQKCLFGIYTTIENNKTITHHLELDIDRPIETEGIHFEWVEKSLPFYNAEPEIENNLFDFENLKCGHLIADNRKYMLRFGKFTVQLWSIHNSNGTKEDLIREEDELLYIRAYKGPKYGVDYSFRDAWVVPDFDSIKYIGGPSGRLVLNITTEDYEEQGGATMHYYTEELFLPLDGILNPLKERKNLTHQLESACQALYYQHTVFNVLGSNCNSSPEQYKNNRDMLYKKTEDLISQSLERAYSNKKSEINFFTTVAGSRTLAMLASFDKGKEIIKMILLRNDIPIRIFSYPRSYTELTKYSREHVMVNSSRIDPIINTDSSDPLASIAPFSRSYRSSLPILAKVPKKLRINEAMALNENVLTVLAEETSYILFKLIYNQILRDAKDVGPGCLSALTDTIFFLQSMQQAKGDSLYTLMVDCVQKLSFLSINKEALAVLRGELSDYQYSKVFSVQYSSSLIYLESFSVMEQIVRFDNNSVSDKMHFAFAESLNKFRGIFSAEVRDDKRGTRQWIKEKWNTYQNGEVPGGPAGLSLLCVVPLTGFNSYDCQHNGRASSSSVFERLVSDKHNSTIFEEGGNVIDILLQNKWKNFGRSKFTIMFLIHLVFYALYIVNIQFASTTFGYSAGAPFASVGHIVCTSIMFLFIGIISVQNVRRLYVGRSKLVYFTSAFNFFDILAVVVVPVSTFLLMLYNWSYWKETVSTCTLILWAHAILRLRIFPFIGVTLETITQLWKSVAPVFAVMFFVIGAFTNAIMVLMYEQPDNYFQEQYAGNVSSGTDVNGVILQDANVNNPFTNALQAFYTVWFYMFGVWDSVNSGDAGNNVMMMILATIFAFFTILIFINLTIARMSGAVERVTKLGDKIWITHFAAVLSEIELLWCTERERRNRGNNPELVFYTANAVSISKQGLKLRKETKKLRDALVSNHEFVEEFGDI